jgi:phosphohistidine phosphatase
LSVDLILWRHADAREAEDPLADLERPLSAKGERQAAKVGKWLNLHLPDSARVLVSPALRTRQTAEALDRRKRVLPALGPEETVDSLLHAARWPDAKEPVVVVGHQPTLGQVISRLMGLREADCPVKKGAVWWLRQRERHGEMQTVLVTVQTPELL